MGRSPGTRMPHAALALAVVAAGAVACQRNAIVARGDAGADAGATAAAAPDVPALPGGVTSAPLPSAPESDKPLLGVTSFVATVYKEPRDTSKKLGYLRVGSRVPRSAEPAGTAGCPGGWYAIEPRGYLCVGEEATLDLDDPILKAAGPGPNLRTALPYRY